MGRSPSGSGLDGVQRLDEPLDVVVATPLSAREDSLHYVDAVELPRTRLVGSVHVAVLTQPDTAATLQVDEPLVDHRAVLVVGRSPPARLLEDVKQLGLRAGPAGLTRGDPCSGRPRDGEQLEGVTLQAAILGRGLHPHPPFVVKLLSELREAPHRN